MKPAFRVFATVMLMLMSPLSAAVAQDVVPPAAPAAPAPAAAEAGEQLLRPAALDALVAPIALYPDNLLSLVLMASSYPLEVVEAQRWLQANKNLSSEQRRVAAAKQDWDQSVKSLIATPSVLEMLSTQLEWTRKLGDAVLAQEADVMDAIQRLRTKAHANNKLTTNKQQRVIVQPSGPRQVIAIEPVDPDVIFVPFYEPAVVFGDWLYPDYPPYFFPVPDYIGGAILATGIAFGVGYALGRWAGSGYFWGGGCNWTGNYLNNRLGQRWEHRPEHRRGVKYGSDRLQQKFGGNRPNQLNFRGRDGRQVVRPGDRGKLGDRTRAGDRRDAARTGDARNRGATARTADRRQDSRARSGQRNVQRSGDRTRAAQRQGVQRGHVAARQAGRGRMSARGGGNFRAAGGGGPAFRGGGGAAFRGGGGAAFRGGGGAAFRGGGGAAFRGGGGGGFRGGGGGGFRGGGGGGRRSDIRLKQDLVLVGRLDSGLGVYRFRYHNDPQTYIGVIAQDAQLVRPDAVTRGRDGYFRVHYDKLGFAFQSYDEWTEVQRKSPGL